MSLPKFITSRTFLIQLILAVVLLIVLLFAAMKGLEKYTSDATVAHVDTEIDEMDYVRITFCCASCDRSFVEIYEYDHTEDEDGNDVDFWRALPRKPRR